MASVVDKFEPTKGADVSINDVSTTGNSLNVWNFNGIVLLFK